MARSSRDSVCLAIVMRNSSQTHWMPDPLDEVDQAPAHPAVEGRNGPLLDDGLQGRAMRVGEFRGLAGRLAVDQARGPMGVEFHHPVAHDLHRDPADPGRLGAGCPLIDRGQGQKAPRLRAVLRRAGDRAQRIGIKVCPERNRHGEPPSFATLNQTCLKPTRPNRVIPSGTWYEWRRRQAAAAGEGYGEGHTNEPEPVSEERLAHPGIAILPLIVVGVMNKVFTSLIASYYGATHEVTLAGMPKPLVTQVSSVAAISSGPSRARY